MITTNLTGNLGNHMWQYAVCRTISEKLGYEWGINPTPSHDYFNGANQMDFMDVDFGCEVKGIINEYHEPWKTYNHVDSVNITMLNPTLYEIEFFPHKIFCLVLVIFFVLVEPSSQRPIVSMGE